MSQNNRYHLTHKYKDRFNEDYINKIYSEFEVIKYKIYLEGEVGDVVDRYFDNLSRIDSMKLKISILKVEILNTENKLRGIKNQPIVELRNNNQLLPYLNQLSTSDLNKLRNIVDIQREFEEIDKHRFNQSKNNSGDLDKLLFRM